MDYLCSGLLLGKAGGPFAMDAGASFGSPRLASSPLANHVVRLDCRCTITLPSSSSYRQSTCYLEESAPQIELSTPRHQAAIQRCCRALSEASKGD